ncbi:hypothetical protein F4678DRAFT_459539 [Xylaria arbuscula]|nr:hypothetical protein F4678DRAFT_459539 [Xylaria arbuscula]
MPFKIPKIGFKKPAAEASSSKNSDPKGKKKAAVTELVTEASSSKSSDRKGKQKASIPAPAPATPDKGESFRINRPDYDPLAEPDFVELMNNLGNDPAVRRRFLAKMRFGSLPWDEQVVNTFGFWPRILPGEPPFPFLPDKPSFFAPKGPYRRNEQAMNGIHSTGSQHPTVEPWVAFGESPSHQEPRRMAQFMLNKAHGSVTASQKHPPGKKERNEEHDNGEKSSLYRDDKESLSDEETLNEKGSFNKMDSSDEESFDEKESFNEKEPFNEKS